MNPPVLITGGSQGIGRGIGMRLAADGYSVVTLDRVPPTQLLADEWFVEVDLASAHDTQRALSAVTSTTSSTCRTAGSAW